MSESTVTIDEVLYLDGTRSIRLFTGTVDGQPKISQSLTTIPGSTYVVTAWAYTSGAGVEGAHDVYDVTHGTYIVPKTTNAVSGASWQAVRFTFVVPAGCTSVTIALWGGPDENDAVNYDRIRFTRYPLSIDFGQAMTPGDFVRIEAIEQVEHLQVGALVSGTTYDVTRNLEGSDPVDWPAGVPFSILGAAGDGRIEQGTGPRIRVLEQGVLYNEFTEHVRIGDLDDSFGVTSPEYGIAFGDFADDNYVLYGSVSGLVIHADRIYVTVLSAGAADPLMVDAGEIAVTHSFHSIETEGSVGSDDLETITGGVEGDLLFLTPYDSAHSIAVKNGAGNITLNGGKDYTLTGAKTLLLLKGSTGWSDVGAGGGVTELADLTDVGSTTPTAGNVLRADGDSWESVPFPTARYRIYVYALDGFGDFEFLRDEDGYPITALVEVEA
jgi:hypothetical protein